LFLQFYSLKERVIVFQKYLLQIVEIKGIYDGKKKLMPLKI
jgi:hypothetical protein